MGGVANGGGAFNKESTSNSITVSTAMNAGFEDISGMASNTSVQGNVQNLTDGGAILGGLRLAGSVVEQNAALTLGVLDAQAKSGRDAIQAAMDSSEKAYEFAMDAGRSDVATTQKTMEKALETVMVVAGVLALAVVLYGWAKK